MTEGNPISVRAGIFTCSVESSGGQAVGVTLSCGYLDADYAMTMGRIYGMILNMLGGFEDASVILTSIDFNAFNSMIASSQTLVFGDYKIIVKVDPKASDPYQLALYLLSAPTAPAPVSDTDPAESIFSAMDADASAVFVYDEETDLNGALGQPGKYIAKLNFALTSIDPDADAVPELDVDQGGSIEVFASPADAIARQSYVSDVQLNYFGETDLHFVYGSAYLRLSNRIDPDEAGRLIAAFIRAVQNSAADSGAAPADAPVVTPTPAPTAAPEPALRVGDTVEFGSYEQDNDASNGSEPITWTVMKIEDGCAVLLANRVLDVYNTYWGAPTWDDSTLREWLNDSFFSAAFNAEEQTRIVRGVVSADPNPNYDSDPGADTEDYVFCLSYTEAETLLTASDRMTRPTEYACSRGVYDEGGLCYWWLRTPGKPGCGASIVSVDGGFDYDYSYDGFGYGVRPAIRLSLGS